MLKVGITGGIGSGKTTVCKIFERFGIPIYYADDRAKLLMKTNAGIIDKVKNIFGNKAYLKSGELNRKHIASQAFSTPEKLKALNEIVHPAVAKDTLDWNNEQENASYTLKEAALIVETGGHKLLDKLIVVSAPQDVRIQRVMDRDDVSKSAVLARMDKQLPEEEKLKHADYIINNDGTQSLLLQIWKIHIELKSLSKTIQ